MTFANGFMLALLVGMVPLLGLLLAATPWLMRQNEFFAVTVPASAQSDRRLLAFKKAYARVVIAVTAVCTIAMAAVVFAGMGAEGSGAGMGFGVVGFGGAGLGETMANDLLLSIVMCVCILLPCFVSFGLMLHYRRKVQEIKKQEKWFAQSQQAVALVAEGDVPQPVSLAWNLLYLPVIFITIALIVVLYPHFPDTVVVQVNLMGEATNTMEKGLGVALFPLLMEAFLAIVMVGCHVGIVKAKRPTNPGSPATSALAYGMFVRAQSAYLLVLGLALCASMGISFVLSAAQIVTLEQMGAVVMLVAVLAVAGAAVLSLVYGQAGSRLHQRMGGQNAADTVDFDDDEHWKLGVFYWNKDDASIFLAKRFGIGWTVNLGRPATWAIIAGFVVLLVVFAAVCLVL